VSFYDVDNVTFDISQTFLYQWRLDFFTLYGGQLETGKFVRIGTGARSYADDFIKHFNGGN